MAEYNVKIYPAAQNDLLDILEATAPNTPEAAELNFRTITEKLTPLASTPESFPLARDTLLRIRGYRTLQVGSFIVFFVIRGKTVELHRILCAKRQYARLL